MRLTRVRGHGSLSGFAGGVGDDTGPHGRRDGIALDENECGKVGLDPCSGVVVMNEALKDDAFKPDVAFIVEHAADIVIEPMLAPAFEINE